MLLAALLAAISVSTVQAETETSTPAWKVDGATYNTVYVKDIITSAEDFTSKVLDGKPTNEAETEKTGAYTRPVVKDGQNEMVITGVGNTPTNVPFYAREGKTTITGGSNITFTNDTSAQAMLQVAGKNASLEISGDGTTVTTGSDDPGFVSIGNMDGSGTLTVTGGATLNVGATIHAGYKTTYIDGNPDGKFDYTDKAKTSLVHNATVNPDGTLYADGDYVTYGEEKFGKATINVTNGGKLNIKQYIQLNEGSINVDKGKLTGESGSAIILGHNTARNSDLNITNGGVVDIDFLQDGSYNRHKHNEEGVVFTDEKMSININVDGNDVDGNASELKVGELCLGIGQPNGTTALNVTGGGKITAGDLYLSYPGFNHVKKGAVQITVTEGSEINVEKGITYGNTTSGGNISMDYKTVINNAGTITAEALTMSGGELTNTGTLTIVEAITVGSGSTLINGGAIMANSLTVGDGGTLTFYIDEFDGETISSTASITLTSGNLTLADGANVDLMLSDALQAELFNGEMNVEKQLDLSGLLTDGAGNSIVGLHEQLAGNEGIIVVGGGNRYIEMTNVEMVSGQLTATLKYVPEPATATLSLLALAGLAARRRRR